MSNEDAFCNLEMCRALMLFDPMHGEDISYESLNQDNKGLYDACGVAMDALRCIAEYDKVRAEGRLHIAPVADGTAIFRPIEYNELFDEPEHVGEDSYVYGYTEIVYGKIGKDWYLTRREAEDGLKKAI